MPEKRFAEAAIFMMIFALSACNISAAKKSQQMKSATAAAKPKKAELQKTPQKTEVAWTASSGHLRLSAKSYIVLNQNNEIVWGDKINLVRPIASLTKMAALIVIAEKNKKWKNLEEGIAVAKEDTIVRQYTRHTKLGWGNVVKRRDLLWLMMSYSDNIAVATLARDAGFPPVDYLQMTNPCRDETSETLRGGGWEKYTDVFHRCLARTSSGGDDIVSEMNRLSARLGLEKTKFFCPTGGMHENVSTAKEAAIIAKEAAKKVKVLTALGVNFSLSEYNAELGRRYSNGVKKITFRNTNHQIGADPAVRYILSKTGTNRASRACLAAVVEIKNKQYAIVLLGSKRGGREADLKKIITKLKML